ncbi:MAG: hypothetical protein ACREXU_15805, partial [Gammaproteobacteria bacterium]
MLTFSDIPLRLAKQGLDTMSEWTDVFTNFWVPAVTANQRGGESKKGRGPPSIATVGPFAPGWEYLIDAGQRSCLFLDVLRERGNQYLEQ